MRKPSDGATPKVEIRWSEEAAEDLERLMEFLLERNPTVVPAVAEAIAEGVSLLESYPEIGQPLGDEAGRRELYIPFGVRSYAIRYRLAGGAAFILRVWHSREERR